MAALWEEALQAIRQVEDALPFLRAGPLLRGPDCRGPVDVAILYHGAAVGIVHYDPGSGTPSPRGLPAHWEGPVDPEEAARRVELALRESYVLQGAEYRRPERAWAVPVAWRGMIILHVHATPRGVLPDAGLQARLRRVWGSLPCG